MRSFDDDRGVHWQAALLEASYGNVLMVFTPIGAERAFRTLLDVANFHDAERLLAEAGEDRLRALLADAEPWQ